jgi:formamidopyrimidine-DNA glycosylase
MAGNIAREPNPRYAVLTMPELPEVETVRRGLATVMEGRPLTRVHVMRPNLRFPFPPGMADSLQGRVITRLDRRAKFLLLHCDDGTVLIIHLGMSGRMLIEPAEARVAAGPELNIGKHEHVIFEVGNGALVRFIDPRRFGMMDLAHESTLHEYKMLANLGPEPIGPEFTGSVLAARIKGKRTPIKSALLDQRVVAGLGNIYVCEALFRAGLSPRRLAATVQGRRADRLVDAIQQVLAEAIEAGGSTISDHIAPSGEIGYFQHHFKVYGREGEKCPGCDCDGAIKRLVQSGRSSFYCAVRQR